MLEIITDFFRYLVKMFHHTHIKSNCGNSGCDCDNMAESSSSGRLFLKFIIIITMNLYKY